MPQVLSFPFISVQKINLQLLGPCFFISQLILHPFLYALLQMQARTDVAFKETLPSRFVKSNLIILYRNMGHGEDVRSLRC